MTASLTTAAVVAGPAAIVPVDIGFRAANGPARSGNLRFAIDVDPANPYLAGHFPGRTMLPAVFLFDALRTAITAVSHPSGGALLDVVAIRSARLLAPMLGGDRVLVEAVVTPHDDGAYDVDARCRSERHGHDLARVRLRVADVAGSRPEPFDEPRDDGAPDARGDRSAAAVMLPVAGPMLFVDGWSAVVPGRSMTGFVAITGDEPCYSLNTPPKSSKPTGGTYCDAYPRGLLFESFGQTSALLWALSAPTTRLSGVMMLAAIRDCRFTGVVRPGTTLRHRVRLDQVVGSNAFLSGEIWTEDGRIATVGTLIAVCRDADPDDGARSLRK